jgi:hypothetical protein
MKLLFLFFAAVVFSIGFSSQAAEERPEVLYTSRLQFLGDVTTARIETPLEDWDLGQ